MKFRTILPFTLVLAASAAVAQTAPAPSAPAPAAPAPSAPTAQPPAAPSMTEPSTTGTTPPRQDANAPLAGANSFTEAQAKSRIEQHGFSSISGLAKDEKGIWRGNATKDGKSVSVMLDFRGNVVSQ